MKRKESGITLLALVVTIIVMLILAGVALKLGIGDNGIIGIAGNTVDLYTNASEQEQEGLNRFVDEFNQIFNENNPDGNEDNIVIEGRPTISIASWNGIVAKVQISTIAGCTTKYKIGQNGQWQKYIGLVDVNNGDTIFARYENEQGVSATTSKVIEDKTEPNVQITSISANGITISVVATAQDNETGLPNPPTYNYYIKPKTESYYDFAGSNTTGEFIFPNLRGNTEYDVRVSTKDIAGNTGSATTSVTTEKVVEIPTLVVDENIFFELDPEGPTKGPVNVTIRVEPELEEPMHIEYSINGTDDWKEYKGPISMNENGTIYAKVTNGTEESNIVSVDITNIDNTAPNIEVRVDKITSKTIEISVSSSDADKDEYTYDYYTKKNGENDYKLDGTAGDPKTTHTFEDLEDGIAYDIKVVAKDLVQNETPFELTESTYLVPGLNDSNTTIKLYTEEGEEFPADKVTNKPLKVEITVNSETQGNYKVQYSTDGRNYQEYTDRIQITNKTTVHVRLWDERDTNENHGTEVTKEITNVDASLSDLGVLVKNEEQVKENTKVTDKDGNTITIPEGFTPQPNPDADPGSNPNEYYDPEIEDGVIVKDENGNEFVWIPVGTINTDNGQKTIEYNRYAYSNWVGTETDEETGSTKIKTTADQTEYFAESLNESEKNSAVSNGGFYLGRYEAGVSGETARTEDSGTSQTVEIKPKLDVYNYVTQSEARALAEGMYSSANYTSSLPSSYAWDTALKFLEQTGNEAYLTDSSQGNYYNTMPDGKTQAGSVLIETGKTTPVKHLYDMGGNVYEWTTERYSNVEATKVSRGGFYGFLSTDEPVIGRFSSSNTADQAIGFRVAIFVGAVNDSAKYLDDLQIGDYVALPNPTSASAIAGADDTGYETDQTYTISSTKNQVNWRYLGTDENGVKLVAETNLESDNADGTLTLYGAKPAVANYNVIDQVIEELYDNISYIKEARSINMEDFIQAIGIKEISNEVEGINPEQDNFVEYGDYYTLTGHTPEAWLEGKDMTTISGVVKDFTLYASKEEQEYFMKLDDNVFNLIFNENYVFPSEGPSILLYNSKANTAYYGPNQVMKSGDGFGLILSGGNSATFITNTISTTEHDINHCIRPVLILDPNIKITGGNGNAPSTAYQLDLSKY